MNNNIHAKIIYHNKLLIDTINNAINFVYIYLKKYILKCSLILNSLF